jgi:hypothetical protein
MTQEEFRRWFPLVLEKLYPVRDAGFVILMVAFPLLERLIREKACVPGGSGFDARLSEELFGIFPELQNAQQAIKFWQVFRHGLLHQATLFTLDIKGETLPTGRLTHDIPGAIAVESDGSFSLHPVLFAKRVLACIDTEFNLFAKATSHSISPLPVVEHRSTPAPVNPRYPDSYDGTTSRR